MKKLVIRVFTELYHWHYNTFGKEDLPAFTALLVLSALQMANVFSAIIVIENLTSIPIANFLGDNEEYALMIMVGLLIIDYLIVRPINVTIKENPRRKETITWIYVLGTFVLFGLCVVWVVYLNEYK